jgi:8-oxo-dGTP pyrophosphatase MutT (NUDIX family)
MAVPDYVLALRQRIGHAPLWLPGVTAVVLRGEEVLLVQRSDNLAWTPITGIVDPGEQPAVAVSREVAEETGVQVDVERLCWVNATPLVVHINGDQAYYLDHLFRCTYISGEAHVADDESVDVAWFPLTKPPPMAATFAERIRCAVDDTKQTRFQTA